MASTPPWPCWRDALPSRPGAAPRPEGGRRLRGIAAPPREAGQALISYVTVVKNASRTIARTIESVRAQGYPHVEHIVLDGCSSDGTLAVIERYADGIAYYASEKDAGLYEALNKAIELSSGDLICVLNADDWLAPDAAQTVAHHDLQAQPRKDRLICTAAWAMHEHRQKMWLPARIDAGAYFICANVCHNGVYATRGAYEASGPYREELRIAADFAWLMSCVDAGVDIDCLDLPTVHYAMGGLSGNTRLHTQECAAIIQRRFPLLDESQAYGLLHCFHTFRHNLEPFPHWRPEHHGRFLRDLARSHLDDASFIRAMALAGFDTLRHPADAHPAGKLSRLEKARRSLYKRTVKLRALFSR